MLGKKRAAKSEPTGPQAIRDRQIAELRPLIEKQLRTFGLIRKASRAHSEGLERQERAKLGVDQVTRDLLVEKEGMAEKDLEAAYTELRDAENSPSTAGAHHALGQLRSEHRRLGEQIAEFVPRLAAPIRAQVEQKLGELVADWYEFEGHLLDPLADLGGQIINGHDIATAVRSELALEGIRMALAGLKRARVPTTTMHASDGRFLDASGDEAKELARQAGTEVLRRGDSPEQKSRAGRQRDPGVRKPAGA